MCILFKHIFLDSGPPRNVRLTLIAPRTVNFTWEPPNKLEGDYLVYDYDCYGEDMRSYFYRNTRATYAIISDISPGKVSCDVRSVTYMNNGRYKRGSYVNAKIVMPTSGEEIKIFDDKPSDLHRCPD